jgi:glycosyltransferase involved in cell wall biosynthesis
MAYELSIVMPCLNEEKTVGVCIEKAKQFLQSNAIEGEIIIADNNSSDNSAAVAEASGAKVIHIYERGYGNALISGIQVSSGKYIIIGDSDDSYDFSDLRPILDKLREGYDLVIGNRFLSRKIPGAMPWHHRYIGNPLLTGIGKLFFKTQISDFHCGLRGFTRTAFNKMDLQTTGMEFASEMIVKSSIFGMKMTEVPTILKPDGRSGKSHLKSFRDGWRHLRFLLMYSPRWLFLYPGLTLMLFGLIIEMLIFLRPDLKLDIHTMLYASAAIMIGLQIVIFAVFTKTFAVHDKLLPTNQQIEKILNKMTLENGLLLGSILLIIGLAGAIYSYYIWREGTFFELGIKITMRIVIASFTLIVTGFQIIFSSFFLNILKLNTK